MRSFIHEIFNVTTHRLNSPSVKVITRSSLPVTKNSIIKGTTNKRKAPVQKGTKTKIVKKNPVKKSNINANIGSIPDLEVLRSQLGIDTLVSNIASLTSIVSNINQLLLLLIIFKKKNSLPQIFFCSYFSSFSYCWSSH